MERWEIRYAARYLSLLCSVFVYSSLSTKCQAVHCQLSEKLESKDGFFQKRGIHPAEPFPLFLNPGACKTVCINHLAIQLVHQRQIKVYSAVGGSSL